MRKLGRPTDQRIAILKNLTTDMLQYGRITTTETRAKEVKKIVDSIIALAIKEKDNFDMVEVKVTRAKLDEKGNKVVEKVKSKNGNEFYKVVREEVTVQKQKDHPSRLHARRQIIRKINRLSNIDLLDKLFNDIANKQEGKNGGYTRIIKGNPRRGDGTCTAILEIINI